MGVKLSKEIERKIIDIEETALLKLFHSTLQELERSKKKRGEAFTNKERLQWEQDFSRFMRVLKSVRNATGWKFPLPMLCEGLPRNRWARILRRALLTSQKRSRTPDLEKIAREISQHKIIIN